MRLNRGHLGFYRPGKFVVLGTWIFHGPHDPGFVVPREVRTRHRVIGNYASSTGVVVLENERTKARTEYDAHTPVIADQSER